VDFGNQLGGGELFTNAGEIDEVGEKYGYIVV
jgi:hypothetical protein